MIVRNNSCITFPFVQNDSNNFAVPIFRTATPTILGTIGSDSFAVQKQQIQKFWVQQVHYFSLSKSNDTNHTKSSYTHGYNCQSNYDAATIFCSNYNKNSNNNISTNKSNDYDILLPTTKNEQVHSDTTIIAFTAADNN